MPAFDGPLDGCYEGKMSFNPKDYYIENIKFQSSTIWSSLWRAPGSSSKLGLLNQSMDIFILDSYVVILFADKWTSWGKYLGPKLRPGIGFFGPRFFNLKNSGQDLSNEGSNFILSSLEVGH